MSHLPTEERPLPASGDITPPFLQKFVLVFVNVQNVVDHVCDGVGLDIHRACPLSVQMSTS